MPLKGAPNKETAPILGRKIYPLRREKLAESCSYNVRSFHRITGRLAMTIDLANTRPNATVARFGNSHGYRIDGDLAYLNAEILCDESALNGQEWALQLWANDQFKIAELTFGLLQPNGSGLLSLSGTTALLAPAGDGEYTLALTLVSGNGGLFNTLEDRAAFVQTVSFVQPRLLGEVSAEFSGDEISLQIETIENPRAADNLSGTLALEVWSLDTPYAGGDWCGQPLASVVLGSLDGQNSWCNCSYISHAAPLPAEGYLTLMLREWTPAGYVTRDYRALEESVTEPAKPVAAVTEQPLVKAKKAATKSKKAPAEAKVQPAAKPAAPTEAVATKPVEAKTTTVSVNKASAAELSAVKGLSDTVAKAIIAARPYATLDELVKAKGMGPKLLAKVRGALAL